MTILRLIAVLFLAAGRRRAVVQRAGLGILPAQATLSSPEAAMNELPRWSCAAVDAGGPGSPSTSALDLAARTLAAVTGAPVRPYSTRDFGRERFEGARSVLVPEAAAPGVLERVRRELPAGVIAFVGVTHSLAVPRPGGVELVVAPGTSQFDILRVAASDAVNAGMETEDLVAELQRWDQQLGIDIWQAETDTIQLRLSTLPPDLRAFANQVYEFCPDIVDQGVGSVEDLEEAIRAEQGILLWWD